MQFTIALASLVLLFLGPFAVASPVLDVQVVLDVVEDQANSYEVHSHQASTEYACTYDSQCGRGEICHTTTGTCGEPSSTIDTEPAKFHECRDYTTHAWKVSWTSDGVWHDTPDYLNKDGGISGYKYSKESCGLGSDYKLEFNVSNIYDSSRVENTFYTKRPSKDTITVYTTGVASGCISDNSTTE